MEYQEIRNQIDEIFRRYIVKYKDGKRKILKIAVHDGWIYAVGKRCRKMAYYVSPYDYAEWESMKRYMPRSKSTDELKDMLHKRVLTRAKKAIEMLSKSGMWDDIKGELEHFVSLSEVEQREMEVLLDTDSYKFYELTHSGQKYSWVNHHFMFEEFIKEKCWKSINLDKWDKDFYIERISQVIKEKPKNAYVHKWHKGYDNTIEIMFDGTDGVLRGWYSEEYTHCANGWYYILLDATHAILVEKD